MKIHIIAFTEKGYRLSERLREAWLRSQESKTWSHAVDSNTENVWTTSETQSIEDEPHITLHAKTAALPAISDPRSLHDIVAEWFTSRGPEASDRDLPEYPVHEEAEVHRSVQPVDKRPDAVSQTEHCGADALIFVGATGIAVRAIAPFLASKAADPAVLVIDEAGHYVISLLSGHLGGANALARTIAALLGAEPIITTATDEEGAFSVDLFAKENGFPFTDLQKAKEVTAKVLRGEKLRIYSDLPLERLPKRPTQQEMELISATEIAQADVILSYRTKWLMPMQERASVQPLRTNTSPIGLRLIAKKVYVGLGARKGVTQEEVAKAVTTSLADADIDLRAVAALVSIDLKKQEAGILAYSYETDIPFVTYSAEELRSVDGRFAASSFVQSVTGVANVCERAAAFAAGRNGHAEVLVHKTIHGNVTTAIAVEV